MKKIDNLKLTASISFTHLRTRVKQTTIATAGVVFGITVFIFLLAYVRGLNGYVQSITLEQTPHVRLFNEPTISDETLTDKIYPSAVNIVYHPRPKDVLPKIKDGFQIISEIENDSRIESVSGSLKTQVFYHIGSTVLNGQITGIDYRKENRLLNLGEKLVSGDFEELTSIPNSLVLGSKLARKLNINTGDKLPVTTQKGDRLTMLVVGVFKTGIPEIDIEQCYASLKTVQRMEGVSSSYITDIKMKLHDKEEAFAVAEELENRYNCNSSDWLQDNALAFENEAMQNMVVYCVAACILLVAGFGIFNILNMMIYEKMKDIAILKALGFSDTDVRLIFMVQALVIGFVGSVIGLIVGFLASYAISLIPYESELFSSIDHLPISFDKIYYICGFGFGILTAAFSGYVPSCKAARIDPVYIIRG